jgi:hypothetical protein
MRTRGLALLLTGAALFIAGGTAGAMSACKTDAQQAFQDCKASCRDDFTAAKLVCRNIDPVCGSACVDARHTCAGDVENILDTGIVAKGGCASDTSKKCVQDGDCAGEGATGPCNNPPPTTLNNCPTGTNGCNAALQQARETCWAQNCAPGQTCSSCSDSNITSMSACLECIDPAQLTAFSCRDTCRDSFRLNGVVQSEKALCKSTFRSCIKACPVLTPPPPA